MKPIISCDLLAVLILFAGVARSEESSESLRGTVVSDLSVYEAGDNPTLYLQLENLSRQVVTGYYANAEQMEIFPCDLFLVIKDGRKLPYTRTTEYHPRPFARTGIHGGGTLTIEVPLGHVARLPDDLTGHYRVQLMADYYPGHVGGRPIEFEILLPSPRASVEEILQGANWRTRLGDELGLGRQTRLSALARRNDQAAGLRVRAIRVLSDHADEAALVGLRVDLIGDRDPIVAMAAISTIKGVPSPGLAGALIAALEHRDLGVRRAAAKILLGVALKGEGATRVKAIASSTLDDLVRQFLSEALAK